MERWLHLDPQPYRRAKEAAEQNSLELLAPTRAAARAFGKPRKSLREAAIRVLNAHGMAIAHPLNAQRALRQAIQQTLPVHDVEGIARSWMPTIQALLQASPLSKVSTEQCSVRARQLVQVTQRYQDLLHQQSQIDLAAALWRAVELQPEPRRVLVYGYFQPGMDELAFINAIAAEGSMVFLPVSDRDLFRENVQKVDWLNQQGWHITQAESSSETVGERLGQAFLDSSIAIAHPVAYAYSNVEAEARGTLAQVKQLLHAGVSAREIAIVARDEVAYGPTLLDTAWEYDVPLRALYSMPLNTTRFGSWIEVLLDVIEQRFPFESTAKLLSHPLCTNPDAEFWSTIRNRHPANFEAWQAICQRSLNLDLSVLKVGNRARRDTWVETIQTILKTFDLRRRCSRWARESLAFSEFDNTLIGLSKPEEEILSWSEFTQELREVLAIAGVPAQPGRGGVELHKPTSVIGAQYRHLFVIGMAEGVLPAPVRNDCVLDFYERKSLRQIGISLELATELAHKEALLFYHLLQTATESVVFSYPRLNNRKEELPSPYLVQLGLKPIAPPEMPVASVEELRRLGLRQEQRFDDPVLGKAVRAWSVERRRESGAPPDEYDGITGVSLDYGDRTFSVSQLTNLGLCPFKWFADKVLKLGEPVEDETDLSPSLRGSLYHKVLELVFKAVQENPDYSITDPDLLEAKFQDAERQMRLISLPLWEVRRVEHLQILRRVLNQPDFLPGGSEAIALEPRFEGTWHGLNFTGRVDRIDRSPEGLVLIDYKTGSSAPKGVSNAEGKACIDLQLPIYQQVAAASLFPGEAVADAYYYSLTKAAKLSKKVSTDAELAEVAERCKSHLSNGHFPVQPDVDRVACQYCSFDVMCRQGSRLSRKQCKERTDGAD